MLKIQRSDFVADSSYQQVANIPWENEWFASPTLKISVPSDGDTITDSQLDFVSKILEFLPSAIPQIVSKIKNYAEDLGNIEDFRNVIIDPHVFISEDHEPPCWSFVVERPSAWSTYGYHVEFKDSEVVDIYGAG